MPKIRTYERQVSTPDPTVRSSANVEAAGSFASDLSKLGGVAADTGEMIKKKNIDREKTDTVLALSNLERKYDERIRKERLAGTLDSSKIAQDYQEEIAQIGSQLNTTEGRDYFNTKSLQSGNSLISSASQNQAQMAARQAVLKFTDVINTDTTGLLDNPDGYQEKLDRFNELVDSKLEAGVIGANEATKFKQGALDLYGENAVRGYARTNPDIAEGFLKKLKGLSPQTKQQMISHIESQRENKKIDSDRAILQAKRAREAKSDAYERANIKKLYDLEITTDEILSSDLTPDMKKQWMRMLKQEVDGKYQRNNDVYNDVVQKIINGEISMPNQISKYVRPEGITVADYNSLSNFFYNSPQSLDNDNPIKHEQADTIKKGMDQLSTPVPIGDVNDYGYSEGKAKFNEALMAEHKKLLDDGKDPSVLYNPQAKEYFLNKIKQFVPTRQDIFFSKQIEARNEAAKKGKQRQSGEPIQRKQGESQADFLKRIGL